MKNGDFGALAHAAVADDGDPGSGPSREPHPAIEEFLARLRRA